MVKKDIKRTRTAKTAEEKEFDQRVIDLARVTRVVKGGKRMRFRACVVIGNRKGKVGYGVAKGADVSRAIEKALRQAKKNIISVPIINNTIPHKITKKSGAAIVMLKPAPKGSGIIAGGAVRSIAELAGISDVISKIIGSNNNINNVRATMKALTSFKPVPKEMAEKNKKAK